MKRTIIFYICLYLWFVLWAPILLLVLPSKKLSRFVVMLDAMGVLWLARVITHIKYQIHYTDDDENSDIPAMTSTYSRNDGKAIIAAKHQSVLEIAILFTHIKNAFFILKRELLWIPIYGWSFWRIGLQPVNRKRGATNMLKLTDAVAEKIKSGMTLVIFPEGTRSVPGSGTKIKRGLLFIAEHLKLPIMPVGTDSGLYWPKHGKKMSPGVANIWFGELLPSNASAGEVADVIGKHSV
ncbi:MAG: 1-acyl-sn-glycerol-3-phosphate acyltransferase [Rickettsiales bacterium]|jgi:1-acyl-sn-glycerol-3-phosphate acyltransferase|nr:1-acyl-sn-glycerol-3-phosphate acyltransferase [Rickettsiales bacterium]